MSSQQKANQISQLSFDNRDLSFSHGREDRNDKSQMTNLN